MTSPVGWIKLHRQTLHNGWLREPVLLTFWIYCLLRANHTPGKVMLNGIQIELQRGQFVTGRDSVFRDTGLSEQQYRTSIKRLKSTGSITTIATNRYTMITVVNWDTYQQNMTEANEQPNEPSNEQPTSNQRASNDKQEVKKEKNKTLSGFFEKLWKAYPRKDGRKTAERHYYATVKTDSDMEHINLALGNYLNHIEENSTQPQFIKTGATWFNNWTDWETENGK